MFWEWILNHDVLFFSSAEPVHRNETYHERYNFNFVVLAYAYMYVYSN